jgi:hypothetical protein
MVAQWARQWERRGELRQERSWDDGPIPAVYFFSIAIEAVV